MVQATQQDQLQLLKVQSIDTRISQLEYELEHLPIRAELAKLAQELDFSQQQVLGQELEVDGIRREVTLSSDEVGKVRERIARNNQRLVAGGLSRELQAILSENEVLAGRQSELEDRQLEAMEKQEAAESQLADLVAKRDELKVAYERLEQQLTVEVAEVEGKLAEQSAERTEASSAIADALLAHYEQLRQRYGGVGAAELTGNRCGGCLLELTAAEVHEIQSAPADAVVHCEECGRILVRSA